MFLYKIDGDTSYECVGMSAEELAELREDNPAAYADWFASDTPIFWATQMLVDGEIVDRPGVPDPKPPTLSEVKSTRKEYIKQRRNQEEARSPFEFGSSLFDYDSLGRERINSAVLGSTIAAVSGVAPNTVVAEWRLWDNTTRDMTVADWMGFKQAEIARSSECFAIAASLKGAIDAANDVHAVNAIDWPAQVWGNDSVIYGNFA